MYSVYNDVQRDIRSGSVEITSHQECNEPHDSNGCPYAVIDWIHPAQQYLETNPVRCNIVRVSESLLPNIPYECSRGRIYTVMEHGCEPYDHQYCPHIHWPNSTEFITHVLWVLHPQSLYHINYGKHLRIIYNYFNNF